MLAVTDKQFSEIMAIIKTYVPSGRIIFFGSRVTGEPKKYSDLDLAIDTGVPLGLRTRAFIECDFADSDLPFSVDVLDYRTISENFRTIVEAGYEVLI